MDRNEVTLVGRVPDAVRVRPSRSGNPLGAWRLVVRRRQSGRGVRVDTISCVSFEPEITAMAAEWLPGDMVEVSGSLRRRWWGSDGAKASAYEVEVHSARRLARRGASTPVGEERPPASPSPGAARGLPPGADSSPERWRGDSPGASATAARGPAVAPRAVKVPAPR